MLTGPGPASKLALQKAGMSIKDIVAAGFTWMALPACFLITTASSSGAAEMKLEAQLIWGTNDEKPPNPNLKEAGPEIRKKLATVVRRPANPAISELVTVQITAAPDAELGLREIRLALLEARNFEAYQKLTQVLGYPGDWIEAQSEVGVGSTFTL